MHVAGGDDGLAHLLTEGDDAAVEIPQRLVVGHGAVFDEEAVVRQRHDLEVVIERGDALKFGLAAAAQHGVEQLARLAGRADDEPLAELREHALRDGGVCLSAEGAEVL